MATRPASAAIELVGIVARTLNSGSAPDDTLLAVARQIHEGLGLVSAAIWRRDPNASSFSALSSGGPPRAAVTLDELPAAQPRATRLPLVHSGVRQGLLELVLEPGAWPPDEGVVAILRNLIAPFLDATALAEDLALEVASRSREISEQRRFTALVIDSLPLGIYVVDRDYRIQFWNRKRETGTQGLRRSQVVGRPVFQVLTRQAVGQLKAEFDRVFESGEVHQSESMVEHGGHRRIYRLSRLPMRLDAEAITHVITIGEDVTEARGVERQVLQNEKLAAVGQLAAGVMHEINNPLATIAACVAAIDARLGQAATEPVQEYLEIIDKEVQRCTKIVDGLLEFSRPQVLGRSKTLLAVNGLVDRTLFLLKHHKRFKRFAVRTDLDQSIGAVLGNEEQLIQVLMAILLNAVDAMPDGGELGIRSRMGSAGEAVVEIEDSGSGIPLEALRKIFEPFYTTKPSGQGTGLGLSIAYGIVSEHGGHIGVDSELGRGSRFRVVLPVSTAEAS
jgi:two-component system, NtrC family, sensor kinase